MKKAILFALIAVGLGVLYFSKTSVSQVQKGPTGGTFPETRDVETASIPRTRSVFASAGGGSNMPNMTAMIPQTKSQRLRNELQQLFQQRLQTMKRDELIARKADFKKELGEDESETKLQQAEKLLQEILKTYPNSQAANQARKMLRIQKKAEGEVNFGFGPVRQ
jgi:hypothetical protein